MSFGNATQEILGRQSAEKYGASAWRVAQVATEAAPSPLEGNRLPPPLRRGRGTWDERRGRRQSLHVRATTSTPAPLRDATAQRPGTAAASARDGLVAGHHGAVGQAGAHLAAGPRAAAAARLPAGAARARLRGPRAAHQPGAAARARQGLPAALRLQAQAAAQAAIPLVFDGVRQTPRLHHGLLRRASGGGNLVDPARVNILVPGISGVSSRTSPHIRVHHHRHLFSLR